MTDRPWIAPRFASLFTCSRPPLSWNMADQISGLLDVHQILSIGVTGSLAPSVLTTLAYGNPERQVNAFASSSTWDEVQGWSCMLGDSPGMEKTHPSGNPYLPVENVRIWDGAYPFFRSEALFVDLPFSHPAVRLKLEHLNEFKYRLVLLGFLESYDGPLDVLGWLESRGFKTEEHVDSIKDVERSLKLSYRLVVATL